MKPMDGRASMTFSSSTTRSRWIGSGSTGCCGPKGMIVRAMMWDSVLGGWLRGSCGRRRGRGGGWRRRWGPYDGRFCAPEGKLHCRFVEVTVEIHHHAMDLHVKQIIQFILVEKSAPVDRGDAWQSCPLGERVEAQFGEVSFGVKDISQLGVPREARGADLPQPIPLFAHLAYA